MGVEIDDLWYDLRYHGNNYRSPDIRGHTLRLPKFILVSFVFPAPAVFSNLVGRKTDASFSKHVAPWEDTGPRTEKNPI